MATGIRHIGKILLVAGILFGAMVGILVRQTNIIAQPVPPIDMSHYGHLN